MTDTRDSLPRRLTPAGLARALAFTIGAWPTMELTEEQRAVWEARLARFDDDTVMSALWDLSGEERPTVRVGDVYVRARTLANREELRRRALERDQARADGERSALPAGSSDSAWADAEHRAVRVLVARERCMRMVRSLVESTRMSLDSTP